MLGIKSYGYRGSVIAIGLNLVVFQGCTSGESVNGTKDSISQINLSTGTGVAVISPTQNQNVNTSFLLKAQSTNCQGQPVATMSYSINNGGLGPIVNGTAMKVIVNASPGAEQILHVKSWGNRGAGCYADVAITVESWPVSIPAGAASYLNLQQESGWSLDASSSISPNPPAVYTINQSGSPIVMTLNTVGRSGLYTGWMAKKNISTSGQLHMLVSATYTFNSVSGIQAWEVGRRATNANGVTDNGQTQLVPISGGLLEFDIVPSASGGWKDTGCRFPMFVKGITYDEELYYINDASGALSLMYVSLNGTVCTIPSGLQSIAGLAQGWAPNTAVMAFQPDANPSATAYQAVVKMSPWMW